MTSPTPGSPRTHGVLLAAGAGRRMGRPKALVADGDGPWLPRGVAALVDGGCAGVVVVLGAQADRARTLLDPPPDPPSGSPLDPAVSVVVAEDWSEGMSASLRAGLAAIEDTDADAALLHLVDLPDVGPDVVRRVLADRTGPADLRRAAYHGVPGHPVLLGRRHWPGVRATTGGDAGARGYLRSRPVTLVECGDLASGRDVDAPTGGQHPTN